MVVVNDYFFFHYFFFKYYCPNILNFIFEFCIACNLFISNRIFGISTAKFSKQTIHL